ncbi:MAG: hypothetical protein ACOYI9_13750, partial [Candidatus Hydrogenedentales bacterium]
QHKHNRLRPRRRPRKRQGREEGREEGKEELAREIVFNMLKKGMGFTEIAELTTLTVQQIENISKWQK